VCHWHNVQVRGATTHYEAVVNAATGGVLNAGLDTGIPTVFCVLTVENLEQVLTQVVPMHGATTRCLKFDARASEKLQD
jgi:6,7-dimethyl-8-ribityllumazine synthase